MQRNFLIWLLASLFYAYQYILRVIPNIIIPELVVRFNIGTTEIGQFCGLYYVGYVLAHIPVGILLDRFGSKVVIPICIALTSLGALPLVSSNDWSYSIIGRIITGIGSSASVLGLFKIIRIYYHREKFAMVRQEVLGEQLVKIQHKQSLANSLEQTTMLHEVTSVIELVGWTMQGTTEVKEWSPEIPEDIEVDMFMAMEDSMKDNVKASYHSLYRDLRPCHVLKWTSSELGRSHAFLLR